MSQQPRVRRTKKAAKKTTHKRISPAPQPIEPDAYYDAPQLAARYGLHEVTPVVQYDGSSSRHHRSQEGDLPEVPTQDGELISKHVE